MADVVTRIKVDTREYDSKIGQSKKKLDEFGKSGKSAGDALKEFSSKMGMSVGSLTAMTGAVAAATAALKVAKDAFFQSESNIDEWGRTVEGAKGAYNTLLDTINGGNWSNFFSNLQKSIKDSRELYDALDRLGSVKANNQAAISIKENTLQQLRLQKQNATDPQSIAYIDQQIAKVSQDIASLKGQSSQAGMAAGRKQIENTISSAFNGVAGAGTLRKSELNRIVNSALTQGQGYFDQQAAIYAALREKGMETVTKNVGGGNAGATQTIQQREFNIEKLTAEERKQYAIAMAVTEGETRIQQGISSWAAAANEGAQTTRELVKNLKQTTSGNGGGSGSGGGNGGATIDKPWSKLKGKYTDSMKSLGTISTSDVGSAVGKVSAGGSGIESAAANMDLSGIQRAAEEWDNYQKSILAAHQANQQAVSSIGAIGQALQSIEDPAAKVMGIVAEAIANVAAAAAQAMAAKDTTSSGWAWIGAAAAITGTMVTSIAAIKQATAGTYANGGMIPGNHYSGDQQLAAVNAGELILNRAQQSNLASQLSGQNNGRREVEFRISGQELVGILRQESNIKSYR